MEDKEVDGTANGTEHAPGESSDEIDWDEKADHDLSPNSNATASKHAFGFDKKPTVNTDEEIDLESAPIRVVPAESSNSDLLEAVEELIRPLRIRPSFGAILCPQCGESVDTAYCPSCGSPTALKDEEEAE